MTSISYVNRVEDYFKSAGRPFTLNDVHSRGFQDIAKNLMKAAIETLMRKGKLIAKATGKILIYSYNYKLEQKEEVDEGKELLFRIEKYSGKVNEKLQEIKELENKLSCNDEIVPLSVLEDERQTLKLRINELQIQADKLKIQNETVKIDPAELEQLKKNHEKCLKEFHRRKRIGSSMLNSIMDNYEKSKKVVLEELEIETDEMVNFDINKFI